MKRLLVNALISALLAAICFCIIFTALGIIGYGNYTILRGDLFGQYSSFINNFIRNIRCGNAFDYSFSMYLGGDQSLTTAYYCLSPFNLLYLIKGISFSAMTIVIIGMKMSLSAFSFSIYCQRFLKRKGLISVVFSLCYTFSAFPVILHFNMMWLDAIYMLPIIIMLVGELFKDGQGVLLSLSYAYIFISNFYMGYMIGIFSAIVMLACTYYYKGSSRESIRRAYIRFIRAAVLAILISGAILAPAAFSILTTNNGGDEKAFESLRLPLHRLINALYLGQMEDLENTSPYIYSGIVALIALPCFYFGKESVKVKKASMIVIGFLLISMICMPVYKFMHAFDCPDFYNYRFSFLVSFTIISFASLADFEHIKLTAIITGGILIIGYIAVLLFDGTADNSWDMCAANAAFIVLYVVILIIGIDRRLLKHILLIAVMGELCLNACITIDKTGRSISESKFNQWNYGQGEVANKITEKDDSFYRIRVDGDMSFNSPSYFGYNGLSTFSSSDEPELRNALAALGIMTENHVLAEKGYTPVTELLLSVKYNMKMNPINNETDKHITSKSYIHGTYAEKEYYLPIGYMVSESLLEYKSDINQFDNIDNLVNAMTDGAYDFFVPIDAKDVITEADNVIISDSNGRIYYKTEDESLSGSVRYYAPLKSGHVAYYATYDGRELDYDNSPLVTGAMQGRNCTNYMAFCDITPGIISQKDSMQYQWTLDVGAGKEYSTYNNYFYYYNKEQLSELYEDLAGAGAKNVKADAGRVELEIYAEEGRNILFLTLPYSDNWTAYDNGKRINTYPCVDKAFLCMKLDAGQHNIVLKYIPKGRYMGYAMTCAGIFLFLHWIICIKNKKYASK